MDPVTWEDAFQRLQTDLDPNDRGADNSMETVLRAKNDWDMYCEYSRFSVDEPHNSMGVNVGWEEPRPPTHNLYSKQSEVGDPDGEPLEMDEDDSELARKQEELREIQEQILLKKAALALKTVEPFVKKTTQAHLSSREQSVTHKGETLRNRVNLILQQRHSLSCLSKVRSPKRRMNSSSLRKEGLLLEDHPLKLRVKALMKQRCCDPCVIPTHTQVSVVTPPPRSRSVKSPPKDENSENKGFQRFLSVLNKGVDINFLSRIVNDDSEDLTLGEELLYIQPPAVENKLELPFGSESQRSNSAASLPGCSQTNSEERKTDPPSQDRSQNERPSLPGDEEKKNGRGDRSLGSTCQSESVKKKRKKEEEKPKVDEQREHLQNILQTLGLSLEVEEMSRLADRTQERLYGKKHEGRRGADSREEQESRHRASHRHYRNLSSSSSSSTCSSSTSKSFSPSPSHRCHSHSRDSKRRQKSEHSSSGGRSTDGLTHQDSNQDSKEAQRPRDIDRDSKEISPYHQPYSQEQTYSNPFPAAFSAFPDYSVSQYSHYTAYHSGTYSAATNSYWTYTQGAIPPSLDPSRYPYPQNTDIHFHGSVVEPNMVYPHHNSFEDINLLVNPDLSTSEGQTGGSGLRCLRVISTKQSTTQSCLKQLTKGPKRKAKYIRKCRVWFKKIKERKKLQKLEARQAKQSEDSVGKVEAPGSDKDDSVSKQSEDEERKPTEEEIKVNLRKKLEAFNQKVKQKVSQPANSLTPQTG